MIILYAILDKVKPITGSPCDTEPVLGTRILRSDLFMKDSGAVNSTKA